jgi:DNA-binding PadR family transcriptional regulator
MMRHGHGGWHGERGEGRPDHGRFREGGGRMRRRMFDGGELRLVLLKLMETQARHGYDLIREIETRTAGAYVPSPGIVYPTLTMLEEQGLIQAAVPEGTKREFTLTAQGKAFLDQSSGEADACLKRLEALGSESSRTEAGPVWRAMQNLKAALGQRLAGTPDKELLFKVADAIDEAARTIERLP